MFQKRDHLQFRGLLDKLRDNARVFVPVCCQQIGEAAAHNRAGGADGKLANLALPDRADFAPRRLNLRQNNPRLRLQRAAGVGQFDPPAGPQKKRRAQFRFKRHYLLA